MPRWHPCDRGDEGGDRITPIASPYGGETVMISADLGKALEEFVADQVKNGRYGSKSEVLREGVRLIQDREARLAAHKAAVAEK
jgi:putative addiction module CopG family antidote